MAITEKRSDGVEEELRWAGRDFAALKPTLDLKDLPNKLRAADVKERDRLLFGIHERFWHNTPEDMLKLLQALMLPKEIILRGVELARGCRVCNGQRRKLPQPMVKSHFASQFNDIIQHEEII